MTLPPHWHGRLALPLIAAPMTLVSNPQLAAAACRNGVIGSFPSHNATSVDELSNWLTSITAGLDDQAAPLAVNIVVHRSNKRLHADLETVIAHRIELVIASVGSPAAIVEPLHDAGCLVFADVATMRHVDRALAAGVDGLVLLTAGAGGQTGWLNPLAFLRAVRARYDGPVVLAGGIADGTALWAAQVAGADLAYMGTKFIATTDSAAPDIYKQAVVSASIDEIELTTKLTGLPASIITSQASTNGDPAVGFEHQRLLDHPRAPDTNGPWSAGHSITGVHDITDAATVIQNTSREYQHARERTGTLLSEVSPR